MSNHQGDPAPGDPLDGLTPWRPPGSIQLTFSGPLFHQPMSWYLTPARPPRRDMAHTKPDTAALLDTAKPPVRPPVRPRPRFISPAWMDAWHCDDAFLVNSASSNFFFADEPTQHFSSLVADSLAFVLTEPAQLL